MRIVTATDLPRLMACNGSRLMEGFIPSVNLDQTTRDEGTAVHWLIEQVHRGIFTAEELIDRKSPNGTYITSEMVEFADEFLIAIIGKGGAVEFNNSYTDGQFWQVNGRADHLNIIDGVLKVDDFKYGWALVEPFKNWTLISHAIGFMIGNPNIPFHSVEFTIYQPRPHHSDGKVRTWKISRDELMRLYEELWQVLSSPSDQLITGPQCYKCPGLVNCPASRLAQMNALDAAEMAYNDSLQNNALSFILDHQSRAIEILEQSHKAYSELALHRMREGAIVTNYTLETGLTNRQVKDGISAEYVHMMTGRNDLTKAKLMTPAQMEKAGVPKEFVSTISERKSTGVKLVRKDANKIVQQLFKPT